MKNPITQKLTNDSTSIFYKNSSELARIKDSIEEADKALQSLQAILIRDDEVKNVLSDLLSVSESYNLLDLMSAEDVVVLGGFDVIKKNTVTLTLENNKEDNDRYLALINQLKWPLEWQRLHYKQGITSEGLLELKLVFYSMIKSEG